VVGEVVVHVVLVVAAGDALAAEENVFIEAGVVGVALGVGFVEGIAAHPVPIEFAVGFLHALAVAVISVIHAAGGDEVVFGVESVLVGAGSGAGGGSAYSSSLTFVPMDFLRKTGFTMRPSDSRTQTGTVAGGQ